MQIPKHSVEVAWRHIQGQTVILQLGQKRLFHELDETASFLWGHADGIRSVDQIAELLYQTYDLSLENAKSEVAKFMADLSQKGLIHWV